MAYTFKAVRIFFLVMVSMLVSSSVLADDRDDVLSFVQQWIDLEVDLEAQSKLHMDDRHWINNMVRRTSEKKNLSIQMQQRAAVLNKDPGFKLLTYYESPAVQIYDDTAIVSFVYVNQGLPSDDFPGQLGQSFVSLVLVKNMGSWKIAHFHLSSGN